MSIYAFLKLVGCLALLMYGMKVMSEALQKMAGSQLRHVLGAMTTNRFTGLLTGTFVTASIQSSTATTVMTVSFVNAGLLTLAQAISVIMGANIGTTLTAWIMSAGFNYSVNDLVYPVLVVGIILIYSKKHKSLGEFIFGISFMFLGLGTLRENAAQMDLGHNAQVLGFFESTSHWGYGTYFLFLLIGGILTMCVQSSAAVMAITMVLCSTGALSIYPGIALVMGENIGTTVTSNVAALTANTQARRAALAHMIFNIFGVIWVLCIFPYFTDFVCSLVGYDPHSKTADPSILSYVLAAFHTSFNVCNVLILIWFIHPLERLVTRLIPNRKSKDSDDFSLQFISGGILSTAELSVLEAQKEINNFAERIQRMFGMVRSLLDEKDDTKFLKTFTRVEKYENISDNMELEIGNYLNEVSDGRLSSETKLKIRAMLREISEIESIGDSCYNLARTLNRHHIAKETFSTTQSEHLHQMLELTDQALTQMNHLLVGRRAQLDANVSFNIENEINNYRKQLRSQNILDVDSHEYSYQEGTVYMDLVNECEKLGDYVVNVVEARMDVKQKDA
jgi:phosphate:Na+ symporter